MASIFRKSLAPLAIASLAAAGFFAFSAVRVMDGLYARVTERALGDAARALAASALFCDLSTETAARDFAGGVAAGSGFRVTLIASDGGVLADSAADSASMENHAKRPEVEGALSGEVSLARRRSATVGMELFYAAAPLGLSGKDRAVLRIAAELPSLEARLAPYRWLLLASILLVAFAAIGGAAFWSRSIARPLSRLADRAKSLAASHAGFAGPRFKLEAEAPDELVLLAGSLDAMAEELAGRIAEAEASSLEKRAILDGMAEAVIAVDRNLRVRLVNEQARSFFGPALSGGLRSIDAAFELARFSALEESAAEALASTGRVEREFPLFEGGAERRFRVLASPLREASGKARGAVLVIEDLTKLKRLERVRKDFVANVSHELRTPIQLVKGFAETLNDGALEDPTSSRRFVEIIERNAYRMERLIDDLLSLAALEDGSAESLAIASEKLAPLAEEAIASILPAAEAKKIGLILDCPPGLEAELNGGLIVQALVNLLGNAVAYSPSGSDVRLDIRAIENELFFEVKDNGIGIPAKDLPRIFERFYRVDKSRGRQNGGTGLGLAIVRHIAIAHGGDVAVESWEGEGSRFELRLPLKRMSRLIDL